MREGEGEALEELVEMIETLAEVEADGQDVMAEAQNLGTSRPQQQTSPEQVSPALLVLSWLMKWTSLPTCFLSLI